MDLGSRVTSSGLSSRAGSGFSPVPEHTRIATPIESNNKSESSRSLRLQHLNSSAGSTDSGFAQPVLGKYHLHFKQFFFSIYSM